MRYESIELEQQAALQTAARMCAAIRTAPKGHGKDILRTMVLTGEDKDAFADEMDKFGESIMGDESYTWYGRDANCVRKANALVLVGANRKYRGVPNCGYCGFENCGECKKAGATCAMAYLDLGVAISSAVITAANDMVDNRIMFSVGKVANHLDLGDNTMWLGIPISISGKNVFFDRGIFHK